MAAEPLIAGAGAVLSLAGLGLVMGVSPTLLAVETRALGRGGTGILAMLAGLALGSVLYLALFQVVDPTAIEHALRGRVDAVLVNRAVDLVAGTLLVLGGIVALRLPPRRRRHREPAHPRAGMFMIDLTNAVVSASSVATMYLAARIVRPLDDVERIAGLAALLVALSLPTLALAALWRLVPAIGRAAERAAAWAASRNPRPWEGGALIAVGGAFLVVGVAWPR